MIPRIILSCLLVFISNCAAFRSSQNSYENIIADTDSELKGVFHTVESGETLWSISRNYGISVQEIAEMNNIEQGELKIGQQIFIPDVGSFSTKELSQTSKHETHQKEEKTIAHQKGKFRWPLDGVLSSKFGVRYGRMHDGIDLSAPIGTNIHAAEKGEVIFADTQAAYGNIIIIQHDDEFITIYAHNDKNIVEKGDTVRAGDVIATVGQTGRATGPHVHFEIRKNNIPRNPLFFLED